MALRHSPTFQLARRALIRSRLLIPDDALPDVTSDPFTLSPAPNSVAGDVFTLFATGGTSDSVPPTASRVTIPTTGNIESQLNLINGTTESNPFTYDPSTGT